MSGVEPERGSMILPESHSQGVMGGTLTCVAKALRVTMLYSGSLAAMALGRMCCLREQQECSGCSWGQLLARGSVSVERR